MNATSHALNKDFRRSVDIKSRVVKGTNERKIYLPAEDFTYGRKNRTPTPVKDVINYSYANRAEEVIKMEYGAYIGEVIIIIFILNIFRGLESIYCNLKQQNILINY